MTSLVSSALDFSMFFITKKSAELRLDPGKARREAVAWHLDNGFHKEEIVFRIGVPSGKRLHNYGKSPCYQWENPLFLWSFSIAM